MNAQQVLEALIDGHTLRRSAIGLKKDVYKLVNNKLYFHNTYGSWTECLRPIHTLTKGEWSLLIETHAWEAALAHMEAGGKVRRQCWSNEYTNWYLRPSGTICVRNDYTRPQPAAITLENLRAKDWILL